MTKIAVVISDLAGYGGAIAVCTLLKHLDRKKYDAEIFVMSSEIENDIVRQLKEAGIIIHFLIKEKRIIRVKTIDLFLNLDKEINIFAPDVIHVHLDCFYSWIWALVKKKRIIFTTHSEASRICNKSSLRLFQQLEKRELIRITGVSQFASDSFEKVFNTKKSIKTIYNPVDIEKYKIKRNYTREGIKFVNVARFHPVKNHKLLIDAFSNVVSENRDAELYLVGDGSEYEEIKAYVHSKQIDDRVRFTGYTDNVLQFLEQADVFVISSTSEALGVSVIEALATGLPVIATKVGGLPELVDNNGVLVQSNNERELTNAMLLLSRENETRKIMGKNSLEKAERFHVSKILLQYYEVYDEEAKRKKVSDNNRYRRR